MAKQNLHFFLRILHFFIVSRSREVFSSICLTSLRIARIYAFRALNSLNSQSTSNTTLWSKKHIRVIFKNTLSKMKQF